MSEKLKPIEPGCMAMTINSGKHTGRVGKVGIWHEKKTHVNKRGKRNPRAGWLLTGESFSLVYPPEKLMRIDGYESDAEDMNICKKLGVFGR